MSSKAPKPSERYIKAFGVSSAACRREALLYGNCVWNLTDDVEKGACEKEFQQLRACFRAALKKTLAATK